MSTSPSPSRSVAPPSPQDITVILYRSLETALTKEYARRYNDGVVLHQTVLSTDNPARTHLEVDYQGLPELSAELTVKHHGGANYDVVCDVQKGDVRRFSYSVPRQTGTRLSRAPHLGEKLAVFLLEELEKRLGRLVLDDPEGKTAL